MVAGALRMRRLNVAEKRRVLGKEIEKNVC